ncbi:OmpA family protein [Dyadobacter luticola]|uniref:OmpA family protein n=1 Tax=Dyadobacter luticola TaxID=1979387 RepID=A0A5R9KRP6_9BACT|nr:OmpA family protein [Dyadobacter luticola]TLU98893.1 OmpA family protein [Dyadobacter luticola]
MKSILLIISLYFFTILAASAQVTRSKVTVRVLDKNTLRPVDANIVVTSQHSDKQTATLFEDKMYKFKLAPGDTGVLTIYAAGYEMLSEAIAANQLGETEVFYLTPQKNARHFDAPKPALNEGVSTVLYFYQSEATVLEKSKRHLEHFAEFLQNHEHAHVELTGHTDNVGDPYENYLLSNIRADSVKSYFISNQINGDRISSRAFGDKKPVAPNDTEQNRRLNRRVEMKIDF